ncbi:MAG: CBS domain-containing protein [Pirellulales bacterium]|nr:CBS domain-containing protein [Pirellulales bacterium]
MTPDGLYWLAILGLVVSCYAAIGAKCLREFSRKQLAEIADRKEHPTRLGEIMRQYDPVAFAVEMLQKGAAAVMLIAGTLWVTGEQMPSQLQLLGYLASGAAVLIVSLVWIPWAVARLWAAPFLYHSWGVWRVTAALMTPLAWGGRVFDGMVRRLAGRPDDKTTEEDFEEEIRTIVTEGEREGWLEEEAREMIEGVIELGDADVGEVMTPRTDMIMMHVGLGWKDALDFVVKSGRTRIPVYGKNRDDITGIFYIKDVLPELMQGGGTPTKPLAEMLREPYYIPQTKRIDDLLRDFQESRNHMALVLDEYGGVSGLVTIEDILEEIVGEIQDEYDKEDIVEEFKRIDDTTAEVLARMHIDELNEQLSTSLPEDEEFDTVGGFVFSELGRIPKVSEQIVWREHVRITVLEVGRRRLERLRIEVLSRTAQQQTA